MVGNRLYYNKLSSEGLLNIERSLKNKLYIISVYINDGLVFNKMLLL
jgi:hypothetical protein